MHKIPLFVIVEQDMWTIDELQDDVQEFIISVNDTDTETEYSSDE